METASSMPPHCLQSLMDAGHGIVAEAGISHNDHLNNFFPQPSPYFNGLVANKIVKWLDGLPIVWDDAQACPASSRNGRTLRSHQKDYRTLDLGDLWTGASANVINGRRTTSRSPSPRKRMSHRLMGSESISQSPPKRLRSENHVHEAAPEPWRDNGDSGVSGVYPLDSVSNVERGPDTMSIARSILTILQNPKELKIYPDRRELPTSTSPDGEQKGLANHHTMASSSSVASPFEHGPEHLQALAGAVNTNDE